MSLVAINRAAWILHLASAVTMSIVATLPATENRRAYMLTYQYTSWTDQGLEQKYQDAYELDLAWLITSFSALSFFFQFIVDPAVEGLWARFVEAVANSSARVQLYTWVKYDWETRGLRGRPNPMRFVEYAISASLMFICIALLSGIRNAMLVAALAVLTAACMLCGLVAEFLAWRARTDEIRPARPTYQQFAWVAHLAGWVCEIAAYGTVWWSTGVTLASSSNRPPWWVWFIIISQMILFTSFGFVQLLQVAGLFAVDERPGEVDPRPTWHYAEFWYILLSLTAKFLLSWTIYASALMGDD